LSVRAFDAVFDSQRVFRCLLRATARPGELVALPKAAVPPAEAVLLTLVDHEVSFCAVGEGAREFEERLSLRAGARVSSPREADFAFMLGEDRRGFLPLLKRGTLEEPASGATAVYAVRRLSMSRSICTVRVSGPGVPGERLLGVEGLADPELGEIVKTRSGYPLGVDVYLVDDRGMVVGLPRSARLEVV